MASLPPDYISGFVDGEGCFALKFRRDVRHDRPNKPIYFYWGIEFAIMLKADDAGILEAIKYTLDCGKISINKSGGARYAVNKIDDLLGKIVPFFEKHPLYAKKRFDFDLWKEAVNLMYRNRGLKTNVGTESGGIRKKSWNLLDIKRLEAIHKEMSKYKGGNRIWKWLK